MPLLWPEALRVRLFSLKQAYVQVCRSGQRRSGWSSVFEIIRYVFPPPCRRT